MELCQSEQIGKVNPVALRVLDSRAWSKTAWCHKANRMAASY